MRKRIGIEAFLKWAYRDELPKAQTDATLIGPAEFGSAWGGVDRYAEVGALVDFATENRFGVVPDRYATGEPHPDAIRAAREVDALDRLDLSLPDDWNPISDLPEIGAITRLDTEAGRLGAEAVACALAELTTTDGRGRRILKGGLRRLIYRSAIMGAAPFWEIEPPELKRVCGANGKPGWFRRETVEGLTGPYTIETDGMDRSRRMPFADAYQKSRLDPCPVDAICDRGLHEIYVTTMQILYEDLAPKLEAFTLEPSPRPIRPWEDGLPPAPRILLGRAPDTLRTDDRADPASETPFAAPSGLVRARRAPPRKNSEVRRMKVA